MELRALEYFVAVAEERHFTRAAGRVHVSQSGLSATIRSLESELREPLFERTTRRVQLTPAGEALLPEARRALAAARAGAEAVHAVHGLQRGTVSLGVMQQMSLIDLPRTLARYTRRYPGIELRLRHAPARDLQQQVLDGELDIAISWPSGRPDSRLSSVTLMRTPLVLVCRHDDPLATRSTASASDLAERRVVGFPAGWAMHSLSEQFQHRSRTSLDTHFEVNDTATALDLVEAGLGVALIAEALAAPRPALAMVPLRGRPIDWVICAIAAAPAPANPAARELWRLITRTTPIASRPDSTE
jgi:DNA-binding transcriptional LysR family regulator